MLRTNRREERDYRPSRCDQMTQTRSLTLTEMELSSLRRDLESRETEALFSLCVQLRLDTTSPVDSLMEFALKQTPAKYLALLRLLFPLVLTDTRIFNYPSSFTNALKSDFQRSLGFRFSAASFEESLLHGPLFLGCHTEHFHVDIQFRFPLSEDERVVLHPIGERDAHFFPPSLTVAVNGIPVLGPNSELSNADYLDLTNVLFENSRVDFGISAEQFWFCLVLRRVKKQRKREIYRQVLERRIRDLPGSLCCPLSGKLMRIPVRSIKCNHTHCFDLISFMKHSRNVELICPICCCAIELDDIGTNWETLNKIIEKRRDIGVKMMKKAGIKLSEEVDEKEVRLADLSDQATQPEIVECSTAATDASLQCEMNEVGVMPMFDFSNLYADIGTEAAEFAPI
jgi:hypothetical protein